MSEPMEAIRDEVLRIMGEVGKLEDDVVAWALLETEPGHRHLIHWIGVSYDVNIDSEWQHHRSGSKLNASVVYAARPIACWWPGAVVNGHAIGCISAAHQPYSEHLPCCRGWPW